MIRRIVFSLLIGAVVMTTACSHHAMKSTPVAFREHPTAEGPVEDRINLWPLFYKRNPAWSALWPLIAASDEGSAVLPLYEYDRNDKDLRLGTVSQLIPPVSRFDKKDDYWRVLNVAKDNKRHAFRIIPVYFQDTDAPWYLLVPVFYWNKEHKVFWTPPFLKYKDGGAVMFPLTHWKKNENEKQIDMLWPLGGMWKENYKHSKDQGVKLLPFFYYENDPEDEKTIFNLMALLLHLETSPEKIDADFLMPLGEYESRTGENAWSRSRLIPFWYAESNDVEKKFFSLPYSHVRSKEDAFRNVMLNLYISLRDNDEYYQSVFCPFFHRFGDNFHKGHMIAPFYMHIRGDDPGDPWEFYSALFNYQSDGTLLNVAGPLYMEAGEAGDKYGSWLWPIYHFWEDGKTKGRAVLPLFLSTKGEGDDRTFITALGGWGREGEKSFRSILWPVYYEFSRKAYKERNILFPFWNEKHSDTSDQYRLLPIYEYDKHNNGARYFKSIPFSIDKDPQGLEWMVGPWLFEWKNNKYRYGWESLLIAKYTRWKKSENVHWRVFPIVKHSKDKNMSETEVMDYGLVSLYESRERTQGRDETHFLQLLWMLNVYDSIRDEQPNGETYTRRRVLWRLFHRETQGEVVATDIFPFIRYDRNGEKDTTELKWAEGLLGYEREGDTKKLRLLWLPIPLP